VKNIGKYAFLGCVSLPSINIPDGVVSIGDDAFYKCDSLIYVRGDVEKIRKVLNKSSRNYVLCETIIVS
jgi:hypothetical protein